MSPAPPIGMSEEALARPCSISLSLSQMLADPQFQRRSIMKLPEKEETLRQITYNVAPREPRRSTKGGSGNASSESRLDDRAASAAAASSKSRVAPSPAKRSKPTGCMASSPARNGPGRGSRETAGQATFEQGVVEFVEGPGCHGADGRAAERGVAWLNGQMHTIASPTANFESHVEGAGTLDGTAFGGGVATISVRITDCIPPDSLKDDFDGSSASSSTHPGRSSPGQGTPSPSSSCSASASSGVKRGMRPPRPETPRQEANSPGVAQQQTRADSRAFPPPLPAHTSSREGQDINEARTRPRTSSEQLLVNVPPAVSRARDRPQSAGRRRRDAPPESLSVTLGLHRPRSGSLSRCNSGTSSVILGNASGASASCVNMSCATDSGASATASACSSWPRSAVAGMSSHNSSVRSGTSSEFSLRPPACNGRTLARPSSISSSNRRDDRSSMPTIYAPESSKSRSQAQQMQRAQCSPPTQARRPPAGNRLR